MNDNVVDFVGLAVQWLFLPVLGVVLPKVDRDLVQLGSMNAVGGCGDVPVVEENSSALVRRDSYVNLPRQL